MTSEVIFDEIITGNLNRVRESLLSVELSSEELEKKHGVHRTTFSSSAPISSLAFEYYVFDRKYCGR